MSEVYDQENDVAVLETEEDVVFNWRVEQFVKCGFSHTDASDLAYSGADLSVARFLHATKCPPDIAREILL